MPATRCLMRALENVAEPWSATSALPCESVRMAASPGLKILVVDDNVDAADMLGELLGAMGHEVVVVHDGAQGLAQFAAFAPDLAILDLGLPQIDGFALAARVRSEPRFQAIPLIALSGYTQPEDVARSHAAGFTYHLGKPADFPRLTRIIESHRARK